MSIKIQSSKFLGGMPCLDYTININGIHIGLSKKDFEELTEILSKEIHADLLAAKKVDEKYQKNVNLVNDFRTEIIKLFYDGDVDDMDSFFLRKTINEIDQDKLFNVLDKYSKFLGFE